VAVVLFGLGSLGSLVIDVLKTGYPRIQIVGAVDHAPTKIGRRLGDLYPGLRDGADVIVAPSLGACLAGVGEPVDVVYHMTESVLDRVEGQMTEALTRGVNVISASEAMFHPALRFPAVAARLDATAKAAGVSIAGVGINPGYIFDAVPLLLARATSGIERISISRSIDVTGTGPGDIDHVGYGLWPADFHAKIGAGRIVGHMGMPESIACLAERLNMAIDRVEESWDTATAAFPVDSGAPELGILEPGRVIGITQSGTGLMDGRPVVTMRLAMFYEPERHGIAVADEIEIVGAHHIRASLRPAAVSLFGAANTIVNATHDIVEAPAGLVNVLDFSIAGARRGGFRYELDPDRASLPGSIPLRPRRFV